MRQLVGRSDGRPLTCPRPSPGLMPRGRRRPGRAQTLAANGPAGKSLLMPPPRPEGGGHKRPQSQDKEKKTWVPKTGRGS
jgi:hypothetical protein